MNRIYILIMAICLLSACTQAPPSVHKTVLDSKTDQLLQAISIVDEEVAWISGHGATYTRTMNGGQTWTSYRYDAIDSLQFRDIHAFDQDNAVLMSAGPGAMSRIFLVNLDSGFFEAFVMGHPEGFLNSIAFWDSQTGLAFGDSFNGELFVLKTDNGGRSWSRIDPLILPPAGDGEGGFAASGACITTRPEGKAWIGTGAGGHSRVLFTPDYGKSWSTYEVPTVKGAAAGITSIRMADDQTGLIVGGDLTITDRYTANLAVTTNGGKTWRLAGRPTVKGALYGSDLVIWNNHQVMVVCGPQGMDYSSDMGQTFTNLDTLNYWAVELHESGFGYVAGTDGKILKLSLSN